MIKRLRIWLKELNLSQQLLTLIFMTVVVFGVFFFVYLTNNINTFVDREMYGILNRSKNTVITHVQSSDNLDIISRLTDAIVTTLVIENDVEDTREYGNISVYSTTNEFSLDLIEDLVRKAVVSSNPSSNRVYTSGNLRILYTVGRIDDGHICIVMLTDDYRTEFRTTLLNSVINLTFIVVAVLFVMLMLWISGIIHPLNQIRNYIERIRKDEDAKLLIDRRDEIGEVADAIVAMKEELNHQVAIKDEMIQNISHDLKTPIATIKSYAESIKDGVYPYETLEKSADVIVEHATRLEKKVYSLLMLNKMGYLDDIAPEGNQLDMVQVINKVLLSVEVVKNDVNITTILNPVKFHGEEEPWRIAIENLVDNAIRYAESEIVITLNEGELEISNDGPLMTEERIKKLFRPYEKGTDGKFGLGLSIVYRVVTTYGYKVEAENLDNGVSFRIYSDLVEKKPRPKKQETKKDKQNKEKGS